MWKKILAALVMFCAAALAMAMDVNKASEAELDGLKGIGPVTSKAIMAERKKGDFKSWQDFIDRVKGVGDKRAAKFSEEGLTVNGESLKGAAPGTKDTKASAKEDKKAAKASAKEDSKAAKASAKDENKDDKASAKSDKKTAKASARDEKKDAKAEKAKAAASAKK